MGLREFYRKQKYRYRILRKVNWSKTLYFNFKKFPFSIASKLPVFIYGKMKLTNISGEIILPQKVKTAMIGFGQQFEKMTTSYGIAELNIGGTLAFKGYAHVGKDCFIYVGEGGYCEMGNMTALGSGVKIICAQKIILGDWNRIGYESQIIDTNSHFMINTKTGQQYPKIESISMGNYNSVSNRVSIMPGTKTPDYCVIASNSLCVKDYAKLGSNILMGGIPAKLIRENFSRDWEFEREHMIRSVVVRF